MIRRILYGLNAVLVALYFYLVVILAAQGIGATP